MCVQGMCESVCVLVRLCVSFCIAICRSVYTQTCYTHATYTNTNTHTQKRAHHCYPRTKGALQTASSPQAVLVKHHSHMGVGHLAVRAAVLYAQAVFAAFLLHVHSVLVAVAVLCVITAERRRQCRSVPVLREAAAGCEGR